MDHRVALGYNNVMKIDLIIFDLDGTLIDSKPDIVVAVNRALSELGYPTHDTEKVGKCIGYGIYDLFYKLLGDSVPGSELENLIESYRKHYRQNMSEHSRPYPGIVPVLEYFKPIHRAVLTNKNQKFADQILSELAVHQYFSAVYGGDAFPKPKPDPMPIQEICKTFRVDPKRTAMIGDSEVDLASAKGAGCISVIVNYGYGSQTEIQKLRPDYQIDRALQLTELFSL